jgi:hypothetical protein
MEDSVEQVGSKYMLLLNRINLRFIFYEIVGARKRDTKCIWGASMIPRAEFEKRLNGWNELFNDCQQSRKPKF